MVPISACGRNGAKMPELKKEQNIRKEQVVKLQQHRTCNLLTARAERAESTYDVRTYMSAESSMLNSGT